MLVGLLAFRRPLKIALSVVAIIEFMVYMLPEHWMDLL